MNRAEKIKRIREILGLSIEMISVKIGFSNSHVSRLENGKTEISDDVLKIYCDKLNVNPEWMFEDSVSCDKTSMELPVFLDGRTCRETVVDRMISLRTEYGMTQKGFSEYVGVPQSMISRIESGKVEPGMQTLTRIAESCHVGIDWLQLGDERKKRYPIDSNVLEYLWNNEEVREMIYQNMCQNDK